MEWRLLLVCTVAVVGVQAHSDDGTLCDHTADPTRCNFPCAWNSGAGTCQTTLCVELLSQSLCTWPCVWSASSDQYPEPARCTVDQTTAIRCAQLTDLRGCLHHSPETLRCHWDKENHCRGGPTVYPSLLKHTTYCQSRPYDSCLDERSLCRQSQREGEMEGGCAPNTTYSQTHLTQSNSTSTPTPTTLSPTPTPPTAMSPTAVRLNGTSTRYADQPIVAQPTRDSSVVAYLLVGVLASLCGGTLCCYLYRRVRKTSYYSPIL